MDKKYINYAIALIVGLLIGVLLRGCIGCGNSMAGSADESSAAWTSLR